MTFISFHQKSQSVPSAFLRSTLGSPTWRKEQGQKFERVSISQSDKWCGDRNLRVRSEETKRTFDFPLGETLHHFDIKKFDEE